MSAAAPARADEEAALEDASPVDAAPGPDADPPQVAGTPSGAKAIPVPPPADDGLAGAVQTLNSLAVAGVTAATEAAACAPGTPQRRRMLALRDSVAEQWNAAAQRLALLRPRTASRKLLKLQTLAELPTQHPSRWGAD
jgi:hypothetical protein